MGGLFSTASDPAKIILIGESSQGKSGSLASLLAAGYNVRVLDSDNGVRVLRSLLLDEVHYPYAKLIKARNIDLAKAFSRIPIPLDVQFRTVQKVTIEPGGKRTVSSERLLAPVNAKAWDLIGSALTQWRDDDGNDYGNISTWGERDVLVLDSFTTISRLAYYYNQHLNARLGASEEGFTHQRDVNGAQSQLRRLLEAIYSSQVKCNVVLICHINRIDDSAGYARTPEQVRQDDPEAIIEVKGYPESVGIKLSKRVGVYFNDSFIVRQSGEGRNARREILTRPTKIDGVSVNSKMSAWLRETYSVESGLAEIFAALRGEPLPSDFLAAFAVRKDAPAVVVPAPQARTSSPGHTLVTPTSAKG